MQPSLLNAGLWVFGALFALREQACRDALASPEALREFLASRQGALKAALAV